ncbi:MAG: glucan biosynthesis protein G [Hyphomicrobiaceae bacterium]
MDRRSVLTSFGALALAAGAGRLLLSAPSAFAADEGAGTPFAADTVAKQAEALAQKAFVRPSLDLPAPFRKLSYDRYLQMRFRRERALWREDDTEFELQFFPRGWLFELPVAIAIVDGGHAKPLHMPPDVFSYGTLLKDGEQAPWPGLSGFRIHGPINRPDAYDEFLVFQGASYFRGVARGQGYGLSARGLAINTARPGGEEVPFFKAFWIERPGPRDHHVIVHALLDSPSTTGAYRFRISYGASTVCEVEATLFPRRDLAMVGLAPLTSMFLFSGPHGRARQDFRPAVHDSQALAITNGKGERLWRPLSNPRRLQTSAFVDSNPRGFGLIQRDRRLSSYEDLDARYERRPSAWVEPQGNWGEGAIELIEIPAQEEIHDNIVVFWRPAKPLPKGRGHTYAYKLSWTSDIVEAWPGARVRKTHVGAGKTPDTIQFAVDFSGPALKGLKDLPRIELSTRPGGIAGAQVRAHPDIGGVRVRFTLEPKGADVCELRLALMGNDKRISEVWLYRWLKS